MDYGYISEKVEKDRKEAGRTTDIFQKIQNIVVREVCRLRLNFKETDNFLFREVL